MKNASGFGGDGGWGGVARGLGLRLEKEKREGRRESKMEERLEGGGPVDEAIDESIRVVVVVVASRGAMAETCEID